MAMVRGRVGQMKIDDASLAGSVRLANGKPIPEFPVPLDNFDYCEEDEPTGYKCERCRDSGRITLDDGHYQYLGDGTAACPECGGFR